jgi:hypothetical protein
MAAARLIVAWDEACIFGIDIDGAELTKDQP